MTPPVVSVLITSYNYSRFLPDCLDSVLCQDIDVPMEIILVDDGSEDDTAEVASRYPVRYIKQEHRGVSASRNICISEARGEWVAFIDADDMWTPDKLALQLALAKRASDCELVFCGVDNFVSPDAGALPDELPPYSLEPSQYLIPALIRRSLLTRLGGFTEKYPRGRIRRCLSVCARKMSGWITALIRNATSGVCTARI